MFKNNTDERDNTLVGFRPDSPYLDSLGRLRVGQSFTIFENTFRQSKNPFFWVEKLVSGATAVLHSDTGAVRLTVTTTSGSTAIYQTRQYLYISHGKSARVFIDMGLGAAKAGVSQRAGFFCSENGLFLEQTTSGVYLVIRTKVTGSVTELVRVPSTQWNLDKMDGTGLSGVVLDPDKAQTMCIDINKMARIRVGFVVDGRILYAHDFKGGNLFSNPPISTWVLPVRYEIENTSATGSNTMMRCYGATVQSEGPFVMPGNVATANRGTSTVSLGGLVQPTRGPLLSIRLKSAFKRSVVRLVECMVSSLDVSDFFIEVIANPSSLTGASFVSTSEAMEKDISATAIVGGTVLGSFVHSTATGGGSFIYKLDGYPPPTADVDGNVDVVSIVCNTINQQGTFTAAMNWLENS